MVSPEPCKCDGDILWKGVHIYECPTAAYRRAPQARRSHLEETQPPKPVLPACVKCGSGDVGGFYIQPSHCNYCHRTKRPSNLITVHVRTDEHLDHRCRTCGYEWEGDCLDARLPQQDLSVGGS